MGDFGIWENSGDGRLGEMGDFGSGTLREMGDWGVRILGDERYFKTWDT